MVPYTKEYQEILQASLQAIEKIKNDEKKGKKKKGNRPVSPQNKQAPMDEEAPKKAQRKRGSIVAGDDLFGAAGDPALQKKAEAIQKQAMEGEKYHVAMEKFMLTQKLMKPERYDKLLQKDTTAEKKGLTETGEVKSITQISKVYLDFSRRGKEMSTRFQKRQNERNVRDLVSIKYLPDLYARLLKKAGALHKSPFYAPLTGNFSQSALYPSLQAGTAPNSMANTSTTGFRPPMSAQHNLESSSTTQHGPPSSASASKQAMSRTAPPGQFPQISSATSSKQSAADRDRQQPNFGSASSSKSTLAATTKFYQSDGLHGPPAIMVSPQKHSTRGGTGAAPIFTASIEGKSDEKTVFID